MPAPGRQATPPAWVRSPHGPRSTSHKGVDGATDTAVGDGPPLPLVGPEAGAPGQDAADAAVAGWRRRAHELRVRLDRRNLAAWVLVPGASLRYFTGAHVEAGGRVVLFVQPVDSPPVVVAPTFTQSGLRAALGDIPGLRLVGYRDETGPAPAVARALGFLGVRPTPLGAEFGAMRLSERAVVEGAIPRARWQPIDADVAALRQVKEPQEIVALRQAARLALAAVLAGVEAVAAGRHERDVAAACGAVLAAHGAGWPAAILVASGPRAAEPHAAGAERELRAGDVCRIQVGASCDGYVGEVTRTVVVPGGSPPPALGRALEVVRAAQQAALDAVRPGTTAEGVDRAARQVVSGSGFAQHFPHRTGHGLGLEAQEPPYLVEGNGEPLRPGMVLTLEPGIYLPGAGGVRLADDVLVTATGAEVLSAKT